LICAKSMESVWLWTRAQNWMENTSISEDARAASSA
jgi:hypothetical protein